MGSIHGAFAPSPMTVVVLGWTALNVICLQPDMETKTLRSFIPWMPASLMREIEQ
jgi:hypothetical protein